MLATCLNSEEDVALPIEIDSAEGSRGVRGMCEQRQLKDTDAPFAE